MIRDAVDREKWEGLFLSKERRKVFLIQRISLYAVILGSLGGVLWGTFFLQSIDRRALSYAADSLQTHAQAHADAIGAVQDQEQQVLAMRAKEVLGDTAAAFADRAQRLDNLDRLFQMSRAWKAAAQETVIRRDHRDEALTYFVSPVNGQMSPLNPTVNGEIDSKRLAAAGSAEDFNTLMALARQRAEGAMPHDERAFVMRDLAARLQNLQGGNTP